MAIANAASLFHQAQLVSTVKLAKVAISGLLCRVWINPFLNLRMSPNLQINGVTQSPCINNCCLDDHDICMGCFRSKADIICWIKSSEKEKIAILDQCASRKAEYRK